jgi:hypothetical protein
MMIYFIHLLVVIHQEVGNLGIQNRKGLIMPAADMSLASIEIGTDSSEVLEKPLCYNEYCKKQYTLQLHNRVRTKWISFNQRLFK